MPLLGLSSAVAELDGEEPRRVQVLRDVRPAGGRPHRHSRSALGGVAEGTETNDSNSHHGRFELPIFAPLRLRPILTYDL